MHTVRTIFAHLTLATLLVVSCAPVVHAQGTGTNQSKLVACDGPRCTFEQLVETGQNVMDFLIILATSIAVIVIAYAGFMYMTAGENSGKVKKAHELMGYAVVGFLVAISAYLVVDVLLNTLNVDSSVRPQGFSGN